MDVTGFGGMKGARVYRSLRNDESMLRSAEEATRRIEGYASGLGQCWWMPDANVGRCAENARTRWMIRPVGSIKVCVYRNRMCRTDDGRWRDADEIVVDEMCLCICSRVWGAGERGGRGGLTRLHASKVEIQVKLNRVGGASRRPGCDEFRDSRGE